MKSRPILSRPCTTLLLVFLLAGCASPPRSARSGGTAALPANSVIQGKDLGRGGATSGGLSSLDPTGNAADRSVYDAREMNQR